MVVDERTTAQQQISGPLFSLWEIKISWKIYSPLLLSHLQYAVGGVGLGCYAFSLPLLRFLDRE